MSIEPLSPPRERGATSVTRQKVGRALSFGFSRRAINAAERRLETELVAHHPQADLALVREAWQFASEAHAAQKRASGEPYVTHPLAVARTLAELGLDPETILAALLHDIPEDTEYALSDIEERFGPQIARLVDGVTKLSKFGSRTHEEQQAENIRKMLLAMAEDIRVVLIKLADRLHNMRTISALPPEKQQRIARQTAEIYAPLAERLGIWQIKWELEDLSFKVLEPAEYKRLAEQLETHRREREGYVKRAMVVLRDALTKVGITVELSGRPKHISSIWKKMQRKRANLSEIYDIHAIRVLVDDVQGCYAALGVVHGLWRPIPNEFDDYIAVPKQNGYQSLHTAVIALDGKPLEVQIRTHTMHHVSEMGVAAHWRYKDGGRADRGYDAKLAWVRQLMDWQHDVADATEFVEGLKLDLFRDQVFVFTPRGDVKDLPAEATPLDFAYRIHTDVGHSCIGAKVNNRLVPLDYKLQNGDIVEIVTTKAAHGPSRDWLKIVQTNHAKEKIRQWFKRQEREENIVHGRESLERELRRLARSVTREARAGADRRGCRAVPLPERRGLLRRSRLRRGVGAAGRDPHGSRRRRQRAGPAAVRAVAPGTHRRRACQGRGRPDDPLREVLPSHPGRPDHRLHHPRPRRDRAPADVSDGGQREGDRPADRGRVGGRPQQTYPIAIRVEAYDRTGLLSEITNVVAEHKVNIIAANVRVHPDHTATVQATLQVSSVAQLARVLSRIEQLKDVHTVQREMS